jgi:hypothetical protein
VNEDLQHLKLLSVFHYVMAGFAALFALFPVFHLGMGIWMVLGGFDQPGEEPPPAFLGWIVILFATVWIVAGLCFAGCMVAAGRFLAQSRRYLFCLIVAAVECMFMPMGTVLGVFTILVLMRPSVKALFGVAEPQPVG